MVYVEDQRKLWQTELGLLFFPRDSGRVMLLARGRKEGRWPGRGLPLTSRLPDLPVTFNTPLWPCPCPTPGLSEAGHEVRLLCGVEPSLAWHTALGMSQVARVRGTFPNQR